MKLYDREGTPNAARIRIVLAQKGLEKRVEFVSVDLVAAQQKQPEFLAMNPIGKTPVLVLDDGFVISESTAGSNFSMADITLFASVAFATAIGLPVDAGLTALGDWRSRVADLPAVKNRTGQALRREDAERRPA